MWPCPPVRDVSRPAACHAIAAAWRLTSHNPTKQSKVSTLHDKENEMSLVNRTKYSAQIPPTTVPDYWQINIIGPKVQTSWLSPMTVPEMSPGKLSTKVDHWKVILKGSIMRSTLFSKRSAHWFTPVLTVTLGHWPWLGSCRFVKWSWQQYAKYPIQK